jgi:hypothetical protein
VASFGDNRNVVDLVVWLVAGGLLAQFAVSLYAWINGLVVLTERRLIFATTILGKRLEQFPVEQTTTIEFKRSFGGRLLGYGSFIFEFAGYPRQTVDYMPYPDQLYVELQALAFPDRGSDGE